MDDPQFSVTDSGELMTLRSALKRHLNQRRRDHKRALRQGEDYHAQTNQNDIDRMESMLTRINRTLTRMKLAAERSKR